MKKSALILIALVIVGLTAPIFADAQVGLVPCGRGDPTDGQDPDPNTPNIDESVPCQLCHLFLMFERIVDFVLAYIVPPIAALMLLIGGFMLMFAGASPDQLTQAKGILTTVVIGIVLIYGSYIIVSTFLTAVGVADWTGLDSWYQLNLKDCPMSPEEVDSDSSGDRDYDTGINCHDNNTGSAGAFCKEECGASPECDGLRPEWKWSATDIEDLCRWCDSSCQYREDTNRECQASNCEIGGWDNDPCNGSSSFEPPNNTASLESNIPDNSSPASGETIIDF